MEVQDVRQERQYNDCGDDNYAESNGSQLT